MHNLISRSPALITLKLSTITALPPFQIETQGLVVEVLRLEDGNFGLDMGHLQLGPMLTCHGCSNLDMVIVLRLEGSMRTKACQTAQAFLLP